MPELPARDSRIDALDGLRAIAILLVLIHNAGSVNGPLDGVPLRLWAIVSDAGWAGVQLFFALSGFLITRILLDSKGARGWMRSFYARRALRIVPVYYVALAVVLYVAPHLSGLTPLAPRGSRSSLWYWTYMSNWVAPFGGLALALPHVWSLAVEEQFYLVWPLIVAVSSGRALARICAAMVLGALAVRIGLHAILAPNVASSAAYTWTIARCDTIALGGLVALTVRHERAGGFWRRNYFMLMAGVTAALIVATVAGRSLSPEGTLAEVAGQPLTGVLSALIVLGCVGGPAVGRWSAGLQSGMIRVASRPFLRWIGKYSYAIYVFHLPIHFMSHHLAVDTLATGSGTRRFAAHVAYTMAVFTMSMVLALISWKVIEQPFLSLKRLFPMPAVSTAPDPG